MGRVNWYAFEIILRSFWQIESDPPGFKEIGDSKLGRFLQTIDARYNEIYFLLADTSLHFWQVEWSLMIIELCFEFIHWTQPSFLPSLEWNIWPSISFPTFCSQLELHSCKQMLLGKGSKNHPPDISNCPQYHPSPSLIIFIIIFCYLQFVKVHSDRDFIGWTITMYLV